MLASLDVAPARAIGVEDSASGLESVLAAAMRAIAIVTPEHELPANLIGETEIQLPRLADLTLEMLEDLGV